MGFIADFNCVEGVRRQSFKTFSPKMTFMKWKATTLVSSALTVAAVWYAWSAYRWCAPCPPLPLPLPGPFYEIPDQEFTSVAVQFLSLAETFDAGSAEGNFRKALSIVHANEYSKLSSRFLTDQLPRIRQNIEEQRFYVDLASLAALRERNVMKVDVRGILKIKKSSNEEQVVPVHYIVELTTVPRNPVHPYGIVVLDWKIAR